VLEAACHVTVLVGVIDGDGDKELGVVGALVVEVLLFEGEPVGLEGSGGAALLVKELLLQGGVNVSGRRRFEGCGGVGAGGGCGEEAEQGGASGEELTRAMGLVGGGGGGRELGREADAASGVGQVAHAEAAGAGAVEEGLGLAARHLGEPMDVLLAVGAEAVGAVA
jgi:hypothetical protein